MLRLLLVRHVKANSSCDSDSSEIDVFVAEYMNGA
jgi:hypothetical protein